jgi:tRNA pseudouridine38-40 synthase
MRNLKLLLSYDGTDFHGWQTQPNGRTVQETLERALADLTGAERVRLTASGRTDAGVHAVGQVANFHTASHLSPHVVMRGVNARLPPDLIVRQADEVPAEFDANRDALRKLYRYVLYLGEVPDLFLRRYCYHLRRKLDVEAMRRAGDRVGRQAVRILAAAAQQVADGAHRQAPALGELGGGSAALGLGE